MKKCAVLLVLVLVASGCAFKSATTGRQEVGDFALEPLPSNAEYEIVGETEGSVSGGVCLVCIPMGIPNNSGTFYMASAPERGCLTPITTVMGMADMRADGAAVYNAIENAGSADFIVAPRFERSGTDYYVYRSINVTVRGQAAKIRKK